MTVRSRASLYGDGLFETMRLRQGQIPLWPWHVRRLHAGCLRLGFDVPNNCSSFEASVLSILKNRIDSLPKHKDYRIRLDVCRSGRGRYCPQDQGIEIEIDFEALDSEGWGRVSEDAVWVDSRSVFLGYHSISAFKTISAAGYVRAAWQAGQLGYRESILTTKSGTWVEGLNSCLFIKLNDLWFVPSMALGGVSGVFRAWAVRQMVGWGLPFRFSWEGPATPFELDALILGNALQGAWCAPALIYSNQRISLRNDPVADQLNEALEGINAVRF